VVLGEQLPGPSDRRSHGNRPGSEMVNLARHNPHDPRLGNDPSKAAGVITNQGGRTAMPAINRP